MTSDDVLAAEVRKLGRDLQKIKVKEAELAHRRTELVHQLHNVHGWSLGLLAELMGVSRSRARQIVLGE